MGQTVAVLVKQGLLHLLNPFGVVRGDLGGQVELPGGHVDAGERVGGDARTKSCAITRGALPFHHSLGGVRGRRFRPGPL